MLIYILNQDQFSGGSSYRREGGGAICPPTTLAKNLAPPGPKFQAIHESLPSLSCKQFFLNMSNSFFRLLSMFDVFDELKLIY